MLLTFCGHTASLRFEIFKFKIFENLNFHPWPCNESGQFYCFLSSLDSKRNGINQSKYPWFKLGYNNRDIR